MNACKEGTQIANLKNFGFKSLFSVAMHRSAGESVACFRF